MSSPKYNSKGQLIEELDTPTIIRGPFQSPKPVSPKRANTNKTSSFIAPLVTTRPAENLAPPSLKVEEQEILAWCDAYQNLKKKGINIYEF